LSEIVGKIEDLVNKLQMGDWERNWTPMWS